MPNLYILDNEALIELKAALTKNQVSVIPIIYSLQKRCWI